MCVKPRICLPLICFYYNRLHFAIKHAHLWRSLKTSGITLFDLTTILMTLQAYAISAIAHWDWPEAWPNLFGHLMQALTSGDSNLVHGAMRVLTGTFCLFTSFKFGFQFILLCILSSSRDIHVV